ncbi:hypothetical protein GIB67_038468, partial [Kingdonia uniflora]
MRITPMKFKLNTHLNLKLTGHQICIMGWKSGEACPKDLFALVSSDIHLHKDWFDHDWKKIEDFAGSKTVIQVPIASSLALPASLDSPALSCLASDYFLGDDASIFISTESCGDLPSINEYPDVLGVEGM